MQSNSSLINNKTRIKRKFRRNNDSIVQSLPNTVDNKQFFQNLFRNKLNSKEINVKNLLEPNMNNEHVTVQVRPTNVQPRVKTRKHETNAKLVLENTNVILLTTHEDKNTTDGTENVQLSSRIILEETNDALPKIEGDLQSLIIRLALTTADPDGHEDLNGDIKSFSDPQINHAKLVVTANTLKLDDMDFLKIKPLNNYSKRDWYLVDKFAKRWKQYIANKKKALFEQRRNAINAFLHKLENKKNGLNSQTEISNKAKLNARDYSNYHHRYKMQKHIIALQKAKLEEQTRLIDELKYNKIVESSKNSVETMREELRKTYFEIDRHLKPKIKCLTNELKIPEIEEQSLVLQCLKMPQFLQRMEKRAREREEKHALIRERRRQMEEERVRLKQQAEIAKAEMDKEERMRMIKELKEKRKREKIENIRKKQLAERMRALQVMADLHYERNLLYRCGLQPLKRMLELKRDSIEKARAHYRFQLLNSMFLKWMFHTEDMWIERNYKAEDFYRKKLLRRSFGAFKIIHHELVLKRQVADDYCDLYLMQLAFRKFRLGVERIKCEEAIKRDRAVAYHESNLKIKTFTCWRSLPALNALQREQEARKARWREKVLQVVPDYRPPED